MIQSHEIDICKIGIYVKAIKGLQSNSSSPADNWVIEFIDNVHYNGKIHKKAFLKIFVNHNTVKYSTKYPEFLLKLKALNYEINIYTKVINPLINNNICPNFIKNLGNSLNCTYNDLLDIIKNKLSFEGVLLKDYEHAQVLKRNISYILLQQPKRPSINDNKSYGYSKDFSLYDEIKYCIILNEDSDSPVLSRWVRNNSKLSTFLEELWNIIFQICVGCYAMSLSKLVHNDLHHDNIFIKDLGESVYMNYIINGKSMLIKTRYQPLIYDFDRSYSEMYGENELLNGYFYDLHSQCNIFIENKDIIKILCYLYRDVESVQSHILNSITKNEEQKINITSSYNLETVKTPDNKKKKCFLQYVELSSTKIEAIPNKWYTDFNNCTEIINNIYDKYIMKYLEDVKVTSENTFYCSDKYFFENGTIDYDQLKMDKDHEILLVSIKTDGIIKKGSGKKKKKSKKSRRKYF